MERLVSLNYRWSMMTIKMFFVLSLFMINLSKATMTSKVPKVPSILTSNPNEEKCSDIKLLELCPELKYNMTASMKFSSLHGTFMNIAEAYIFMSSLQPMFSQPNNTCTKQIRFLICSSLFPMCMSSTVSTEAPRLIYPCRNICELVHTNCANDQIITLWPKFLNCEKLPQNENLSLCLNIPDELSPVQNVPSTVSVVTSKSIVNSKKNSDDDDEDDDDGEEVATNFQGIPANEINKINMNQQQTSFWWKLTQSQNIYNKVSTLATCPLNFTINDFGTCSYKCGREGFFTTQNRKIVETCILIFSVLCFIFTLFSLITFWTESTKFQFPERPALFLTLSYNLLSLSYLFRTFHQKSTVAELANSFNGISDTSLVTAIRTSDVESNQCMVDSQCLAYFIIINYFIICSSLWFLIFGICWYLSTNKQWSSEALQRKSGLFHFTAWVTPLAFPIIALLFPNGTIRKSELTGICNAQGFTEIPSAILLIAGAFFIILSAKSIIVLRSSWKNEKLSRVMRRILIFGAIFFLPSITSCFLMFLEHGSHDLRACLPGEICYQPSKKDIHFVILRYACLFIGGVSGQWFWSRKTCLSCRQKLQYNSSQSTATLPETSKNITYSKYVSSIQRSLLNNNYQRRSEERKIFPTLKKDISGVHRTPGGQEQLTWIPSNCI